MSPHHLLEFAFPPKTYRHPKGSPQDRNQTPSPKPRLSSLKQIRLSRLALAANIFLELTGVLVCHLNTNLPVVRIIWQLSLRTFIIQQFY